MTTQMLEARKGHITEEMEIVAKKEGVSPEYIRDQVAVSHIVIPKNIHRDRTNICGIGAGLDVKVNSLMGTSSDRNDKEMEKRKLRLIEEAGADAFMDLSTGDDIDGMRAQSIAHSNIAAGCVPIYQAAAESIEKHGSIVGMTAKEMLDTIEKQCQDGMDFMAIHSAYNFWVLDTLKQSGRLTNVVSRGGSFLTAWMHYNQKDNPLFTEFDKILEILKSTDTVLSIGDAIRPGCNWDSLDAPQVAGLMVAGDLAKRAIEAGVQVMIEGPGHVPLNHIATTMQLQKQLCHGVPYYILGFLATDVAPGYDNITGAIGGTFAGMYGADFLCNLTPAEHLGLPTEEDVVTGVRTARLAADCVNMLRRDSKSYKRSLNMAKARVADDPQAQIDNALFPELVKERMSTEPAHDHCAACSEGLCPADYAYQYFFGD
ncbi:MAG: B12 lower ligand biosynthesis ThiC-like protein BzaB [Eubacteriaceae bacterium]|jgi:ThiC-like protein 1|uniref:Phosphomethylpyrimidine synthase n=1 Tax=Candidatus Pseudoramibacter fermentans TaxID=2594427 RepID=A0A6L5GT39_9FIRM|nr:B12 lower ligand biosynthesis ThiC-like protein BzaB [Candidatus Pseudoramibacter fermentans]RRF93049.1 MAG: B12 lower ligand biosynthesis ThiC-like protein BzaB [Eubacteriaceae bacterium]